MGLREALERSPVMDYVIKKLGFAGLLALSCYMVYDNHPFLRRLEDSFLRRNVPIEEKHFPDPAGIDIKVSVNDDGKKEGYFVHYDSNTVLPIYKDMLPDTRYILKNLTIRAKEMDKKEAKQTLETLVYLQKELYDRF